MSGGSAVCEFFENFPFALVISGRLWYDIFVGITSSFLNSILGAMPVKTVSLSEVLSGNIAGGIFTAVACLVLLITWLVLICQFIMKGIEMLLMRMGIPFASIRTFKFRWRSIS